MKARYYPFVSVAALALVTYAALAKGGRTPTFDPGARRPVDLVICLDTSGSMTDLIDSARARLWDVVNELAKARPTPLLRVGLFTYGSPNLSTAARGWVVRQTDLTDDLDTIYAKMMAMSTTGGDEYVGWVLNDAVKSMSWSTDPSALKIIFVAGNESADQAAGSFNFRYVAELARSRGITINSIYCGQNQQGINEHWDQVAMHGGGTYTAIDMQRATAQIPTPQDSILIKLNVELNATYIPYGRRGREGVANQLAQDSNASRLGQQSSSSRIAAKATRLYSNSFWDLVDACDSKDFNLDSIKKEELPDNMKSMAIAERHAYVLGMKAARNRIQKQIQEVNTKRSKFLQEAQDKAGPGQAGLDDAILKAIRKQAKAKGFKFDGR